MPHRRTWLAVAGVAALLAITLPARPGITHAAMQVQAARWGPARPPARAAAGVAHCAEHLGAQLAAAEAWGWTLCFDEGERCALLLAWQRQRAALRGWLACAVLAAVP